MHPLREIFQWLPEFDFAVLAHGFAPHERDYGLHIQDCLGGDPGEHMIEFTHVVRVDNETRVGDPVGFRALTDPESGRRMGGRNADHFVAAVRRKSRV
jgi:hypothetical protein